jgi:hypothetical protein
MRMRCACGAVGLVLPPDFGYDHDDHVPLVEWSGGDVGDGRVALESLPPTPDACPRCGHRDGAFLRRFVGRPD